MATKATKTKSRADEELASLQALLGEEGFNNLDTNQVAALGRQGIQVPRVAPDARDAATAPGGPVSDAVASGDADSDEDIDQLTAATQRLSETRAQRRAADKLRKEQPDSDAAIRQAAADQAQEIRGLAARQALEGQRKARDRINVVADRIGSLQTPGGLGMLLLILGLLLLILIEVKGQPRLIWLWLVLTRRARLMTETDAKAGVSMPTPPATPATAGNGNATAAIAEAGVAGVQTTLPGLPSAILSLPSVVDRYIKP